MIIRALRFGLLALATCMLSLTAQAEEAGRSPTEMTDDERAAVVTLSAEYDACLREAAQQLLSGMDDPRVIADGAAAACQPKLDSLRAEVSSFQVSFQDGLVNGTCSRALRRLLPTIVEGVARQSGR